MVKYIPLTQGKMAIVDDEDYDYLMQWKWQSTDRGYAVRSKTTNGKQITIHMHREVNKTPDGLLTDHINGNGLDNRKANLRSCTTSENLKNQRKPANKKSSKFKGVSWRKDIQKWEAYITVNRKVIRLGHFSSERVAAMAYNNAAIKHHGEFARLNII